MKRDGMRKDTKLENGFSKFITSLRKRFESSRKKVFCAAGPTKIPWGAKFKFTKMLFEGVFEQSHRSGPIKKLWLDTALKLRQTMDLPDTHAVLFVNGGAQDFMAKIIRGIVGNGGCDFAITGEFTKKAAKYTQQIHCGGSANIIFDGEKDGANFTQLPDESVWQKCVKKFLWLTLNNTTKGTEYQRLPDHDNLILDGTSSVYCLSEEIDWSKVAVWFSATTKNFGFPGYTVAVIRKDVLAEATTDGLADIETLSGLVDEDGNPAMPNTPNLPAAFMMKIMLDYLIPKAAKRKKAHEKVREHAEIVYDVINKYDGFYRLIPEKEVRSITNICFTLASPLLETGFLAAAAAEAGIDGIKGYRNTGGIRISLYLGADTADVVYIANFLEKFFQENLSAAPSDVQRKLKNN